MQIGTDRKLWGSLKGKVMLIILAIGLAAGLWWGIAKVTFTKILAVITEVTEPNTKLVLLNSLFREIARLDRLHYTTALQNPSEAQATHQNQTGIIQQKIDSLLYLNKGNTAQLQKIDSVQQLLLAYNTLFQNYINLRTEVLGNQKISGKMHRLANQIDSSKTQKDSTVVTMQKRTTTTTIIKLPADDNKKRKNKRSLFNKKRVTNEPETEKTVNEELTIQIDTLAMARQDSIIEAVQQTMLDIEKYQRNKGKQLLMLENKLGRSGIILIDPILNLLHEVEEAELNTRNATIAYTNNLVKKTFVAIYIILLLFFVLITFLAIRIFADIKRSKQNRQQLLEAKAYAEHLSMVKQRFLANMSHEIRTPLQSIIGFAEQIRYNSHRPDPNHVEAIYRSSAHLLQIVNEVLDYSRIISGKFTFEHVDFDLLQLLDEVASVMALQAETKQLQLIKEWNIEEPLWLNGDAFRIKQILYNLLGNAIKYTDAGMVHLRVHYKAITDNNYSIEFEVSDTGIGIAPENIKRIFNQFEQLDISVARVQGGTGLGLTIVKALVEGQNGDIEVNSQVGKGSCFTVTLALNKAAQPAIPEEYAALPNQLYFDKKVIVVDDDQFILQLCSAILTKHHIAHSCYNKPETLLSDAIDESIGLILMDIQMPGISGVQLAQAIRQKVRHPVKIYALTAQAIGGDNHPNNNGLFTGLLTKPFKESELLALLMQGNTYNYTLPTPAPDTNYFSGLEKITIGDEDLLATILLQFVTDTTADLLELTQYATTDNRDGMQGLLHRLEGRTSQIGAEEMTTHIQLIEVKLPHVTYDEILELIAKLNELADGVIREAKSRCIDIRQA